MYFSFSFFFLFSFTAHHFFFFFFLFGVLKIYCVVVVGVFVIISAVDSLQERERNVFYSPKDEQ
jgi:hypothetical protein